MSCVWITSWRGLMPRSCASVEPATPHPWPSVPTRRSSGTKTSSISTSLNSASPVDCTSGCTTTPGACMSMMRAVMPSWRFGAVGSLRVRQRPQSANWAYEVQTLRPVTR